MEEEMVAEQELVINENELLFISEYIKSLDVTFEIVSPEKPVQFQIESAPLAVTEIPVYEHQVVAKEEQVTFTFDLPLAKSEPEVDENKILFELTNETKNIVVNQPVQVVPMTELNENGIVKYSLEEYMEVESDLMSSKPVAVVEEPVAPEMDITMKVDEAVSFTSSYDEISPLEMSIEETLKFRADERRRKLKDFNYKFSNSSSRIDEFEREPAYKRSGIDVTTNPLLNTASRTSLGVDSNDDLQLRSNNSFLHDNVD
jgi:cell division protein FtsZ